MINSITVELREAISPYSVVTSASTLVRTDGLATVNLPASLSGGSYYIAVNGRTFVETWSKVPVTLGTVTNFNFN